MNLTREFSRIVEFIRTLVGIFDHYSLFLSISSLDKPNVPDSQSG